MGLQRVGHDLAPAGPEGISFGLILGNCKHCGSSHRSCLHSPTAAVNHDRASACSPIWTAQWKSPSEIKRNLSTHLSQVSQKEKKWILWPSHHFLHCLVARCWKYKGFYKLLLCFREGLSQWFLFTAFHKSAKMHAISCNHFWVCVYSLYIKTIITRESNNME